MIGICAKQAYKVSGSGTTCLTPFFCFESKLALAPDKGTLWPSPLAPICANFPDEPEAALSPNRQLAALSVIDQLVKAGCQFIIATHSPILLAYPNAKILVCDATGITETAYEDTEHYAVTRDFLNHYPRRIEQLLADSSDGEDED